jgi:hypothetical protein
MNPALVPSPSTPVAFNITPDSLPGFGLNCDYIANHWYYVPIYGAEEEPVSPPHESRESTPVPEKGSWHELSFLDEHFEKFVNKWIMCSKKSASRPGREVCTVRIKDCLPSSSDPCYELLRVKGPSKDYPQWEVVKNPKELVPFYGSDKNHDRLWVIIEGKEVGCYCKAISYSKEQKDSSVLPKFTVALASVKDVDGVLTTVIDTGREPIEVYATHVAAVWQPDDVKAREPRLYVKYKQGKEATAAKRRAEKHSQGQQVKRPRKEKEVSEAR